jgi:hypothetical protein
MKLPPTLLKNIRQGALTVASAGIALGLNGCGLVETSLQRQVEKKAPQQPTPSTETEPLTPEQLALFELHFAEYMKGGSTGDHSAAILSIGKRILPHLEQKFRTVGDPLSRSKIRSLMYHFNGDPCPPCGMG